MIEDMYQQQQPQSFHLGSPADEIAPMQQVNPESLHQAPPPAAMIPMLQPQVFPFPYTPAHQPFPLIYPADPAGIYPPGLMPDQYGYCFYTAAYQQPLQQQQSQQLPSPPPAQQQQQPQQQPPSIAGGHVKPVSQTGPYAAALLPAAPATTTAMPLPPPMAYPGYQAYAPIPMNSHGQPHLMPYFCCPQMPYQQPHMPHQDGCQMAVDGTFTAAQPPQHPGYAEQFYHQQQATDSARPEANFEVQPQADTPKPPQPSSQPHHALFNNSRRRNGYMHNILYKTELCRDVQEKGACPRGKTCQFAHSPSELHDPRKHPLYKTAFCFDFKNRGFCPRGPHCFHVHEVSELKTPPPMHALFAQQQQQQHQQQPHHQQQPQQQQQKPQQPQQLMASTTPSAGPSRNGGRSGRMRRRQQNNNQQQMGVDEAPGTSRATSKNQQNHNQQQQQQAATVGTADTPFNFLMKKLQQQQQQEKPCVEAPGSVRAIEEKTRTLGLADAWSLDPVRAAQ